MATYTKAQGTPIIWAHGADFNPAGASDLGTTEDYELDLTALADGVARQGEKGDLGATRPGEYAAFLRWETGAAAPTAGTRVDVYWAASTSATAANDNAGGTSGADGTWPADGGRRVGAATPVDRLADLDQRREHGPSTVPQSGVQAADAVRDACR